MSLSFNGKVVNRYEIKIPNTKKAKLKRFQLLTSFFRKKILVIKTPKKNDHSWIGRFSISQSIK